MTSASSEPDPRSSRMILLVRTVHGVISAFFLTCIGVLFYAGVSGEQLVLGFAAAGALAVEGAIVGMNGGDCPLGQVHHRYGDERAFFELFLPSRLAKLAVPALGLVAATGTVRLVLRAAVF